MSQGNLHFQNITISSLPGAGKTTLAKAMAKTLHWDYFCGGDFMRQYAVSQGLFDEHGKLHHDATVYSDEFDRQVDLQVRKTLQERTHIVVDSWLSGFMAQGLPGVMKILVICSDDAIRIDRVVNRDEITVEEAKVHIFERTQKNLEKWRRLYDKEWQEWVVARGKASHDKPIYFWYPQLYDLVLDTYALNKQETLNNALERLGFKAS